MSVRFKDERKLLGRMDNGIIEDLLHGSIDMHIHPGPDPVADRPCDSGTMALEAQKAGMAGIVLKSVTYPTASDAFIIQKHLTPDLRVFGAVVIEMCIRDRPRTLSGAPFRSLKWDCPVP